MRDKLVPRLRDPRQSEIRAMTRRVAEIGGVSFGQGTCRLPPHPEVLAAAQRALAAGHNSYTPHEGIPELRRALAARYRTGNGLDVEAEDVLVTCGATGAFECVVKALLAPGDEVVMFEPVYQYHVDQVTERGGVPRWVRLHPPDWTFDPAELESAFTGRTKLVVFSNPNNPTGRVLTRAELEAIAQLCRERDVLAVADEVYEHILGEGREHLSLAALPGMAGRTITISSASKTLYVTGWRVGWLVAPRELEAALAVVSDETYVCAPAPLQHAVAHAFGLGDGFFRDIRQPFREKRDRLLTALEAAGFAPHVPEGACYILADHRDLGFGSDEAAVAELLERRRVGAVPGSEFSASGEDSGFLRFCFALPDDELDRGCELLTGSRNGPAVG